MVRLALFNGGGLPNNYVHPNWIARKENIQQEILALPPKPNGPQRKRKTVDVGGRILTLALLDEQAKIDSSKKTNRPTKQRRLRVRHNCTVDTNQKRTDDVEFFVL
ncbi:hypothetical protein AC1031_016759 [Aphanomyces cochlioides]|nr:hypothetical protein AC1031_016759 [Aphanomyces cochlioides]